MTATAVIVVEGVLKQNTTDGVISQGSRLYHGLKEQMKVAVVSNSLHPENVERWLLLNGFTDHPYFFHARTTDPWEPGGTRLRQIRDLRESKNFIEIVVEPDPEIAAVLMSEGITVLNFLHPKYQRPEFRPDWEAAVKPWDALVAEVERQQLIKAKDRRMDDA